MSAAGCGQPFNCTIDLTLTPDKAGELRGELVGVSSVLMAGNSSSGPAIMTSCQVLGIIEIFEPMDP